MDGTSPDNSKLGSKHREKNGLESVRETISQIGSESQVKTQQKQGKLRLIARSCSQIQHFEFTYGPTFFNFARITAILSNS